MTRGDMVIEQVFRDGRVIEVRSGRDGIVEVWCDYDDEVVILEATTLPVVKANHVSEAKGAFRV